VKSAQAGFVASARRLLRHPGAPLLVDDVSALAAAFFDQADILNAHGFFNRFNHVVDRERRDRHRRER